MNLAAIAGSTVVRAVIPRVEKAKLIDRCARVALELGKRISGRDS